MDAPISSRLSNHPVMAGLPAHAIEQLSGFARSVKFDTDQVVLSEGADAAIFYLLLEGRVALSTHAPGKGHLLIQTLGPGEALGLSWLFPPFLWQFDARAVDPVASPSSTSTTTRPPSARAGRPRR